MGFFRYFHGFFYALWYFITEFFFFCDYHGMIALEEEKFITEFTPEELEEKLDNIYNE